jgi:hypothetical protein
MKTVNLTYEESSLAEVLELAGEDTVLLRTPEGREFILAEVDDFEAEVERVRQNPELMQFLEERSRERNTYSIAEVRELLDLK